MRTILATILFIIAILGTNGCRKDRRSEVRKVYDAKQARLAERHAANDEVIACISYVQDTRTGICFAYMWDSRSRRFAEGGPALATVPCDAIPEDLLLSK